MATQLSINLSRYNRTICLPVCEDEYQTIFDNDKTFRSFVVNRYEQMPELFPINISEGFQLKDRRMSLKQNIQIRRIKLRDGISYSIRPSFLMPYMTARTSEVDNALFMRKFSVPFWALTRVFGKNHMYWYRLAAALGRNSVVGTTVRTVPVPEHLLADEHHQTRDGEKNYIATTVGGGCCLGIAVAETSGTEDLTKAYGVFKEEAFDVDSQYAPKTVNTDGWKSTQAAWKVMFPFIIVIQCFLHAWLKIRDRAKHLKNIFSEISNKVWHAYHAPDRRTFSQRIRQIKVWAEKNLKGIVLDKVMDLCNKRDIWKTAYNYPEGHRTSNMLDRVMRSMNKHFVDSQHLHGCREASELHCRGWALLFNFAPWHPITTKINGGWHSPAERLNKHRYHENWLQNLLISSSLGGFRHGLPKIRYG